MKNELVQTITKDDLILNGLFVEGDVNKPVTILVHGFTTDFYSHKFFHQIQQQLGLYNLGSIAIQTRGTGIRTEFLKKDRMDSVWIGSFYERLEEAHLDISAWIGFLKEKGYKKIVLAGHSLGTIKAVRYLFEGEYKDEVTKLVLLAPFDKNGYIERKTKGKWKEYYKIAESKVQEGKGDDIIPDDYDDFPMSYQNYVSWYTDDELSCIWDFYRHGSYDFPILKKIQIPVQILVGDKDDFFYIPEFSTASASN